MSSILRPSASYRYLYSSPIKIESLYCVNHLLLPELILYQWHWLWIPKIADDLLYSWVGCRQAPSLHRCHKGQARTSAYSHWQISLKGLAYWCSVSRCWSVCFLYYTAEYIADCIYPSTSFPFGSLLLYIQENLLNVAFFVHWLPLITLGLDNKISLSRYWCNSQALHILMSAPCHNPSDERLCFGGFAHTISRLLVLRCVLAGPSSEGQSLVCYITDQWDASHRSHACDRVLMVLVGLSGVSTENSASQLVASWHQALRFLLPPLADMTLDDDTAMI